MVALKSIRGNTWGDVGETLAKKQIAGELVASVDFSTASALHVGSKYAKLKKKFEKT